MTIFHHVLQELEVKKLPLAIRVPILLSRMDRVRKSIQTTLGAARQAQIRRHWRRLRARWRLHRIEWNGRRRPLEPPPGYEHYYTPEEMFPGLKHAPPPPKNPKEFFERLRTAWRIYIHYYYPDPELTKIEKSWSTQNDESPEETYERVKDFVKTSQQNMDNYKHRVEQVVDKFTDDVQAKVREKRPQVQELIKNRMEVLKASMTAFSVGYKETVEGRLDWMPTVDLSDKDDDHFNTLHTRTDNKPVRYEAQTKSESIPQEGINEQI